MKYFNQSGTGFGCVCVCVCVCVCTAIHNKALYKCIIHSYILKNYKVMDNVNIYIVILYISFFFINQREYENDLSCDLVDIFTVNVTQVFVLL